MTHHDGGEASLLIGDGETPESLLPVGGLRSSRMQFVLSPQAAGSPQHGAWRVLQSEAGPRSLSLSGSGAFAASAGEARLLACALSGRSTYIELRFGAQGERVGGMFLVSRYERTAPYDGEVHASLTLESCGEIVFTEPVA